MELLGSLFQVQWIRSLFFPSSARTEQGGPGGAPGHSSRGAVSGPTDWAAPSLGCFCREQVCAGTVSKLVLTDSVGSPVWACGCFVLCQAGVQNTATSATFTNILARCCEGPAPTMLTQQPF